MAKKITDKKYWSNQISTRFLEAVDAILASHPDKLTASELGELISISSSNINRIRTTDGNYATLEAIGVLCDRFTISAHWLITGRGDKYANDDVRASQQLYNGALLQANKSLQIAAGAVQSLIKQQKTAVNKIVNNTNKIK
jgi:DNA-binding Xre family transcriptional regulator